MFRCQFSGEVSEPAEYRWEWINDPDVAGRRFQRRVLVKAAEKPVKVAIEFRNVIYENYQYDPEIERRVRGEDTYGFEITKEIIVRKQHLEAVKKKYRLD